MSNSGNLAIRKKSLLAFVHIEKACGTTLHHIFRNNMPLSYAHIRPKGSWKDDSLRVWQVNEAVALLKKVGFIKALGGHPVSPFVDYSSCGKSFRFITILRHPITRFISHYNYQKNKLGSKMSFEEFADIPKNQNLMVRRIAGSDNVEQAINIIDNHFSFVGLLEHFDESLLLLKNCFPDFNFNVHYEKKNSGRSSEEADELGQYKQLIAEKNELDLILYEHVANVTYQKFRDNYPGNLALDVIKFRDNNQHYTHSNLKWFVSGVFNKFIQMST
jgi:hypothetical protein